MSEMLTTANSQISEKFEGRLEMAFRPGKTADYVTLVDTAGNTRLCNLDPSLVQKLVASDLAADFALTILNVSQDHLRRGQDQGRRTKGMFDAALRRVS